MAKKKSFKKHKISFAVKRKLIQIAAFGFCNFRIGNFASGKIYTGKWKNFCFPGLNCYSCPAANFSCPIGAMQAVSGSLDFNFSFYVAGFLMALGVLLGRAVCGFLCPFGLFQELLHKIPSKKIHLPKFFRYVKYAVLLIFVLILPVADKLKFGTGDPAFCKYVCPQGILEGAFPLLLTHPELKAALGFLFSFKTLVLALTVIFSIFVHRFFCKILCPLGAVYALFNKISFLHISLDSSKCSSCSACKNVCPMDVNPAKEIRSAECILCGKCAQVCASDALKIKF